MDQTDIKSGAHKKSHQGISLFSGVWPSWPFTLTFLPATGRLFYRQRVYSTRFSADSFSCRLTVDSL